MPTAMYEEVDSLADAVTHLGGIPLARIRMHPPPGTATESDLDGRRLCELVDGILVEKATSTESSLVAAILVQILGPFVHQYRLGLILGADGMLRLQPGLVRIPDVSFLAASQLTNGRLPPVNVAPLHPDLAVEVLSPSNTPAEMARKRREYFASGTSLVWIIDPETRTAEAWTSPTQVTHLAPTDALDGGSVVPGFRLPLPDLFARTTV